MSTDGTCMIIYIDVESYIDPNIIANYFPVCAYTI